MNRPIKFRGKPIQMVLPNGEYLLGDFVFGNLLVHKNGTHRILVPIDGGFENFAIAPSTLGQFTGITDEEGRSVFEGDILEANYKYDIITSNGSVDPDNDCICYGVVEFCNDTLQWILNVYKAENYIREYLKEQDSSYVSLCIFGHEYGYDNPNVKVIGNRYDNPELIEKLE